MLNCIAQKSSLFKLKTVFASIPVTKRSFGTGTNEKFRILFFGTDNFASNHLKALIDEKERPGSNIESIGLVCPPDKRTGRNLSTITPSQTKGIAEAHQLNIFHTPPGVKTLSEWQLPLNSDPATATTGYDLGVVVSFGYFIPPHIISLFQHGAINVHPSLLPKYRGAAPIQHTILSGDTKTGVTIQELDAYEFDAGRILSQQSLVLDTAPVYSRLKEKLTQVGCELLVDTVRHFKERKLHAQTQDISQATKAPKVEKYWSELDYHHMSAWQAVQLHRAIGEQYPLRTAFSVRTKKVTKNVVVQLLDLCLINTSQSRKEPGTFVWDEASKSLHISFGDGSVMACSRLKMENRGAMTASDFKNGYGLEGHFVNSAENIDEKLRKRRGRLLANMKPFDV
ncbi:formyl transferase [Mycotypha africana]|uniref:formyl transferase n=1 Tax=Mycotypha africana TaxID=64632 RepID=UPI002300DAEE|nr:formyl transferase [Mycotypha africana]KAI8967711.1 formyl transferase [Mycotypha africana]